MAKEQVFLALGANLGEPVDQLVDAVERLAHDELQVVARSRLYRSAPVGPPGQPDYINAAIEVTTTLSPTQLLKHTQGVEQAMGRVKTVRWGPRLVDIDIAIYGSHTIDTPDLVVPHRELANRRFVLAPLADLASAMNVPGLDRTIQQLLEALDDNPDDLSVLSNEWPQ
ncbi:MAG: 2-amino-4-hydroxy-6-hydroxymethyldihydropteridine diphosphokinase [Myxococcota bacterium]